MYPCLTIHKKIKNQTIHSKQIEKTKRKKKFKTYILTKNLPRNMGNNPMFRMNINIQHKTIAQ